MEARVDIKKLQLLNDRIVQTIDALNQVRFTVHGLSHSAAPLGTIGTASPFAQSAGMGLNFQSMPAAFGQLGSVGFTTQPVATPFGIAYAPVATPSIGLSHSSANPVQSPIVNNPYSPVGYVQPIGASVAPYGTSLQGWPNMGSSGLSHSNLEEQWIAEMRAQDPRRLSQTFPYCYNP